MSDAEQERAERIETEYWTALKVLAVVAERLLAATKGDVIEIADAALADSPDLTAWRPRPATNVLMLKVSR